MNRPFILFLYLLLAVQLPAFPSDCFIGLNGPGLKVVLDPGHGGRDSATKAESFYEKNVVLNIALEIKAQLLARGYEVVMTRETDVFIPLTERAKIKGDVFISLHANTVPERIGPSVRAMIKGMEIFTGMNMPESILLSKSKRLASCLWNSLNEVEGMNVRGNVKEKALAVLRPNYTPAVLLELGYLTNKEDLAFLTDRYCYKEIGTAICNALEEYRKPE
ncbi:N-acetylmuramoyl-L-alanine amidase family protein [Desertivirga arenae]|uniref:N-acetylmuramoyl-L-alanine amidase family protein n=1 Tax=Desertivirga arenae TaxID=2810309 RepID=UPI001A95876D|nr:N-acetylmuramoyl-L-alanine amidase [Pedobacter sp. SYSU D00823]